MAVDLLDDLNVPFVEGNLFKVVNPPIVGGAVLGGFAGGHILSFFSHIY